MLQSARISNDGMRLLLSASLPVAIPAQPVDLSRVFDADTVAALGTGARLVILDSVTIAVVLGANARVATGTTVSVPANGTVTAARWPMRPLQAGSLVVAAPSAPQVLVVMTCC